MTWEPAPEAGCGLSVIVSGETVLGTVFSSCRCSLLSMAKTISLSSSARESMFAMRHI